MGVLSDALFVFRGVFGDVLVDVLGGDSGGVSGRCLGEKPFWGCLLDFAGVFGSLE